MPTVDKQIEAFDPTENAVLVPKSAFFGGRQRVASMQTALPAWMPRLAARFVDERQKLRRPPHTLTTSRRKTCAKRKREKSGLKKVICAATGGAISGARLRFIEERAAVVT